MQSELETKAFLPLNCVVFCEKVPQNASISTPFSAEWFKAESQNTNLVRVETDDKGFIALRGGGSTGLCFITFTTLPLNAEQTPACSFRIRVNAVSASITPNANFNGMITCDDNLRVGEQMEVALSGSVTDADILTDEQGFATLTNKRSAGGKTLYTFSALQTAFVCIRAWNSTDAEHTFKIVQILPPRHKKLHRPFFNFIAYQLASGEELKMSVSNAPNMSVKVVDESVVKLTNYNGTIINNSTGLKGVKDGQTQLIFTIPETPTCKKTTFALPIVCKNNDLIGSFRFGNSAGGTTTMSPQTNQIQKDEFYTIKAVDKNPTNNEFPRFVNLSPQILDTESISEANKAAQVRVRAKNNGLGLLALRCADKEMNAQLGISTGGYRLITRWQVATFECIKYPHNKILKDSNSKAAKVIELQKNYEFD